MVSGSSVRFEFNDVHFDGEMRTKWDGLLRIVGDFALWVGDLNIYQEEEFCLVEFAVVLANWLTVATDFGPNFDYTSMESETQGLVRFTVLRPGVWRVSAAHQNQEAVGSVAAADLRGAAWNYLRRLRDQLLPGIEILQYVKDAKVRRELASALG